MFGLNLSTEGLAKLSQYKTCEIFICYFRINVAQPLYARKDVVACAQTGAGKTSTN